MFRDVICVLLLEITCMLKNVPPTTTTVELVYIGFQCHLGDQVMFKVHICMEFQKRYPVCSARPRF